jgi:hypothetical protein
MWSRSLRPPASAASLGGDVLGTPASFCPPAPIVEPLLPSPPPPSGAPRGEAAPLASSTRVGPGAVPHHGGRGCGLRHWDGGPDVHPPMIEAARKKGAASSDASRAADGNFMSPRQSKHNRCHETFLGNFIV